jgi:hypothetical protein
MALYDEFEEINLGSIVNDGTGDDLRVAFSKVKDSIAFLYNNGNGPVTGQNIGSTGTDIFIQKNDTVLEFRKIDSQGALKLTASPGGELALRFFPTAPVDFNGQNITNIGTLYGNLEGTLVGTIRSPGNIANNPPVDVSVLNRQVNTFDYGSIVMVFTDPITYLLYEVGTDMGTFTNPSPITIDAGTI